MDANEVWRYAKDETYPSILPSSPGTHVFRPEFLEVIEATIDSMSDELRALSLSIHDNPELRFEEHHAHDVLTTFMSKHGFQVTPHHLLPTAWLATFVYPPSAALSTEIKGIRTLGINSEMDALPGIGHACGHNLIAIAGVAVACAVKAVMEKCEVKGKIELLGTPGEEGGAGKVLLLDLGAYKNMDVCLMCHPAPGPQNFVSLSSSLALQEIHVEYFGHTAHAGLSPWEGRNAQDAAVLAYNNISALRQQLNPKYRVHGVIQGPAKGKEWSPNVIPDHAQMTWYVRAPTWAEAQDTVKRVKACFEAAALATACTSKIDLVRAVTDLRQNKALGDELVTIVKSRYGDVDYKWGIDGASTDFGNVTYALPSLHPGFAIPTEPNGGNHTRQFAKSARTLAAHRACLNVSKAIATVGMRILGDEAFFVKVKESFMQDKGSM